MHEQKRSKRRTFPQLPNTQYTLAHSDKWSMLVLYTLETDEAKRFKELQRNIPDISQKMLTATLRMLEADGLVKREAFAEVPPRVEYSLSDKGKTLLPHINALLSWATDNMDDIYESRRHYLIKD